MNVSTFAHPYYFALYPQGATVTLRAHGLDISKYDQFFKPETATAQLDFVIQRVSYGIKRDEAFATLVPGVMQVPIHGGYHYLSSWYDWRTQADAYLDFIAGYDYHFHCCDFEGAFNTLSTAFAKQAWDWIQYIEAKTGKPVLLYTSLSLYNQYIAPSEKVYGIMWNTVPYWQAQWFLTPNPNGTPTMPTGRYTWRLWQYTDKANGTLYGVARPTACDLDVFHGTVEDMRTWLGITEPPPLIPYGYSKLRRCDSDIHIVKLEDFQFAHVTDTHGQLRTISSVAKQFGARYAINGDGWYAIEGNVPLSLAASDGVLYQPEQYDFRPFVNIGQSNAIAITHFLNNVTPYNLVSGTRYLVKVGLNAFSASIDPEHITERQPRSAIGHTADGKLILCVVDGRSSTSAGVTLRELAAILIECGAAWALELDGGGSSTLAVGGEVVNVPSGPPVLGEERAVVNHLLVFTQGDTMTRYEAIAIADGTRLRPDHNVLGTYLASYPKGTKFHGDNLFIATVEVKDAYGAIIQAVGDKWLEVVDASGAQKVGWVAITHKGLPICTLSELAPLVDTLAVTVDVVVNVEGYAPKTFQVNGELTKA